MSIYHIATLTGCDQFQTPWQANINWSQGLKLDAIEIAGQPLSLCLDLQGFFDEKKLLKTALWQPGIEGGCLIGYFHHESEKSFFKARFDIRIGLLGLYFGLQFRSSLPACVGWKTTQKSLQPEESFLEGFPRFLAKIVGSDQSLILLEGKASLALVEDSINVLTESAKEGCLKLLIGRRSL